MVEQHNGSSTYDVGCFDDSMVGLFVGPDGEAVGVDVFVGIGENSAGLGVGELTTGVSVGELITGDVGEFST